MNAIKNNQCDRSVQSTVNFSNDWHISMATRTNYSKSWALISLNYFNTFEISCLWHSLILCLSFSFVVALSLLSLCFSLPLALPILICDSLPHKLGRIVRVQAITSLCVDVVDATEPLKGERAHSRKPQNYNPLKCNIRLKTKYSI